MRHPAFGLSASRACWSIGFSLVLTACSSTSTPRTAASPIPTADGPAAPRAVSDIADEYYQAFIEAWPLQAFLEGLPEGPLDRLDDNSLEALARWQKQEDAWLQALLVSDNPAGAKTDASTYAILREKLESSVASRVCHNELWSITQMFGPQQLPTLLASLQPVGSDEKRNAALARYRAFGRFFDTEITNLTAGLAKGYSAPRRNVEAVVAQLDGLLAAPPEKSPALELSKRDGTPAFEKALTAVLAQEVYPALSRYRAFLHAEYLPAARTTTAVAHLPDGEKCYRTRIRAFTTLDLDPQTVHQMGLEEGARIRQEMQAIAQRAFKTDDLRTLFRRFRTEPRFRFKSRAEVIKVAQAALDRSKEALPRFFGRLPRAKMVLEPCLRFEENSGCPNSYLPAAIDGSRPGQWKVNTNPEHASRIEIEAIAFHEGYPGHHLQIALAQEAGEAHPITRVVSNSGYTEGWALYAERLANEMGAYSSDLAQLGRLSSAAWRAARLVVDPGLHALGWSREQAIKYMLDNTVASEETAASEVDRYIIWPGQATAYMVGRLELDRLRKEAEAQRGEGFDLRAFHDQVLGHGAVPLPYLRRLTGLEPKSQASARR